jgi:hypothetical protein
MFSSIPIDVKKMPNVQNGSTSDNAWSPYSDRKQRVPEEAR